LAFERSTSSKGEGREFEAELRGYWNKRVGNKGAFSFPKLNQEVQVRGTVVVRLN